MKKNSLLLISTLFLASSSAWAKVDSSSDLRHCLDLQSNIEIAKCAGELTPRKTDKPSSKKDVVAKEEKEMDKKKAPPSAPPKK